MNRLRNNDVLRTKRHAHFPDRRDADLRRERHRNEHNRYVHFRQVSNPVAALFIMLSHGITPRVRMSRCVAIAVAR